MDEIFDDSNCTISERHDLRKRLKLMMLSNMKMKKQLKVCIGVRSQNRFRLENEIVRLNKLVHTVASNVLEKQQIESINTDNFANSQGLSTMHKSTNRSSMKNRVNREEYKFHCDKCSFKSKKKTPLSIHMRKHDRTASNGHRSDVRAKQSNSNMFYCDQCKHSTRYVNVLLKHKERIHLSWKTYKCNTCNYKTQDRSDLSNHKITNPSHNINVQCTACKVSRMKLKSKPINDSADKDNVQHNCGRKWACQHCGLLFISHDSLKKHEARHKSDTKYKCDMCDYSSASKYSLVIHIRKHSGEKPFSCTKCPFSCTTKSYLQIHLNNHLGIKPYGCDLCPFRSADSSKIAVHKRKVHTENRKVPGANTKVRNKYNPARNKGDTKVMCKVCGKMFNSLGTLLHHEKDHNLSS